MLDRFYKKNNIMTLYDLREKVNYSLKKDGINSDYIFLVEKVVNYFTAWNYISKQIYIKLDGHFDFEIIALSYKEFLQKYSEQIIDFVEVEELNKLDKKAN